MESTPKAKFLTIDEYHSTCPQEVRAILEELRNAITKAAPMAEEVISYNMPAFKLNGILVYYAANKKHIGFYTASSITTVFKDDLADFKTSKGTIQFPIGKAIPTDLVKKIVEYRVNENLAKAKSIGKK